ncbi:Aste57867_8333 [Aphanomyces stellatus]|uniref:Aste57867_8333 protein n=1 Tax=Aphanomyces stellatus TaxID=120398 RepID=A0A485KK21_9STRA|nr:hypothetical protein As57867_008301 [Aphanomyces stellatus]VFT85220.1 Aste57867_8333 [Aphanomyces stellatus]
MSLSSDEAEYFGMCATLGEIITSDDMQGLLDEHYGILMARVGAHPFWPARVCEMEEWIDYLSHRQRKGQICVYFYGSHNYGWILRNNVHEFMEEHPSIKSKKGTKMYAQYLQGVDEAKKAIEAAKQIYHQQLFSERIPALTTPLCRKQKKIEVETDVPCAVCKKKGLDEQRIICDGDGCEREYHMSCLKPPLVEVPPGSWWCPICNLTRPAPPKQNGSSSSSAKRGLTLDSSDHSFLNPPPLSSTNRGRAKNNGELKATSSSRRESKTSSAADLASEERCFLCGLGGELVVCEFPKCTKVYHQLCLGAYPFPMDEETEWICPRHTCVLSGKKEIPLIANKTMWHCLQCPVAIDDDVLPSNAALSKLSRRDRTMICPHCNIPTARVRLAKLLERIWSIVATNRQGMPFCGPLLVGIERPPSIEETPLDLFQIVAKIRRLEYESETGFVHDIKEVMNTAFAILSNNQSPPLLEAARTMGIIVDEQCHHHTIPFQQIQALLKIDGVGLDENQPHLAHAGQTWPIVWRKECMPFGDKSYVHIDARSVDEWTIYVSNSTLYANLTPRVLNLEDVEELFAANTAASLASSAAAIPPQGDHENLLSLSDGIDVLVALSDLGSHPSSRMGSRVVGPTEPTVYREELGVTPSICEMDVMFQQQSALLRKALSAHATLEHAWNISKQHMLGMQENQMISIGEGRLAAELRMANNNLKARLRTKDTLLQQLTSDHLDANNQMKQLQLALAEKDKYVHQLERQLDPSKKKDCGVTSPVVQPLDDAASPTEKRQRNDDDDGTPSTPQLKRGRGRPPKKKQ